MDFEIPDTQGPRAAHRFKMCPRVGPDITPERV
jgi:hypothetical protein